MRMTGWFALTASIYKLERLPDSREVMVAIKNRLSIVFISLKLPLSIRETSSPFAHFKTSSASNHQTRGPVQVAIEFLNSVGLFLQAKTNGRVCPRPAFKCSAGFFSFEN